MISISEGKKTRRIPNLVKWAGGKGYIIENLMNYVPTHIDTYHEPFFGGGSLFWNLKHSGAIDRAIISDVNPHLINLLNVVKSQPTDLAEELTTYVGRDKVERVRRLVKAENGLDNITNADLVRYMVEHTIRCLGETVHEEADKLVN